MNRHFGTHVDELFLSLDLKYISAAITIKVPVLYCHDSNKFIDYAFCIQCNKGCYYNKDANDKASVWLKHHITSDCSKHWSTHEERFQRSMRRQEMTEIEVPKSTSATSQVLKENNGTELAKVQEDLEESKKMEEYYEEETRKLRQMRSRLQEWYTKLDTKIIQIRRELGDSEKDIAVNDALNEIGEVLDEFSLDTEA